MVDVDANRMSESERELRTAHSSSTRAITFAIAAGTATMLLAVRGLLAFVGTQHAGPDRLVIFGWTMACAAATLITAGYWISRARPQRYILTDKAVYLSSSRSLRRLMSVVDVHRLEIAADPGFSGVASITLTTEFGDEVHLRDLAEPEAWAMQIETLVIASGGHVKMPEMSRLAQLQRQVDLGADATPAPPIRVPSMEFGTGEPDHVVQSLWALKLFNALVFMFLGAACLGMVLLFVSMGAMVWSLWLLAILGGFYFVASIIASYRILLRERFGLLGSDVVVRDRKADWHPLVALGDIDRIRTWCTDSIAENYVVSFKRGRNWTSTGQLEHGDRWALIVAERASQIQAREVPLNT